MTFEEIAAAGIDVSAPENQYTVKVNVTLNVPKGLTLMDTERAKPW